MRTMARRPTTAISILGTKLDRGVGPKRWNHWRPNVGLCGQESQQIDTLVLLHSPDATRLAEVVAADVAQVSPQTQVQPHVLPTANPWDFEEVFGDLLDFARGFAFRPEEVDYLVHITTGSHVAQICLFLLTESRHLPARLAQTSPPRGTTDQPFGGLQLIDLDLSRYDRIAGRFAAERAQGTSQLKAGIDTKNPAYNQLISQIEQVALQSRRPILLQGPTGAGKSRLARSIHALRHQRHRVGPAFVEVNCATLRGDAAMAALFGHERGAFTGAERARPGLLRAADDGLLFLDEIAELGLDEQAMLLHAIETGRFLPLGADQEVESAFQLIAGTNQDLRAEVHAGRFRDDLLARIDTWSFTLPGLAQRREDIAPNLDFELDRFTREEGRRVRFNAEAHARFLAFATHPDVPWHRNFRDLSAAVTRMATLARGGRITGQEVDAEIQRLSRAWSRPQTAPDPTELRTLVDTQAMDLFDQMQLGAVVAECRKHPSLSAAGRALFAHSRLQRARLNDADRLRKYLARFGLSWEQLRTAE